MLISHLEKLKPYLIWLTVTILIKSITPSFSGLSGSMSSLFTGVILIYTPCIFFWFRREKMDFLRGKTLKVSIFWFIFLSAGSFLAYITLLKIMGGEIIIDKAHILFTQRSLKFWISSLIVVALPEEFFFRGFLYDRIEGSIWVKIVITSILFSVTHLVISFSLLRILTFIPGLALGYLRSKTDEIYTPALLHNFFNIIHWVSSL